MAQLNLIFVFLVILAVALLVQDVAAEYGCPWSGGSGCTRYCKSIGRSGGACSWERCDCYA